MAGNNPQKKGFMQTVKDLKGTRDSFKDGGFKGLAEKMKEQKEKGKKK